SASERALLQKHIEETLQLSPGERQRLAAHLAWLLLTPGGMSGLKKRLAALTSDQRDHLAELLTAVAASDGRADPRETKILEKLLGVRPRGFAIPPPNPALDMTRVRRTIAETRQVSSLLAGIFSDDEPPAKVHAATIGTLDAAHSEFLRRLSARDAWPREEIERLASELALMTDGALETINDFAYAAADEPIWEEHDPLE